MFTIAVAKDGATTEVTIDLAAMGATPRRIDAVADFINSRLEAAGVMTRFAVTALGPNRYGFRIDGVSTETLRFTPAAASPAVYVAGIGGSGAQTVGQMRKLDGADSAAAPLWTIDLGPLDGGWLSGLAVEGDAIYLVGDSANGALDAGGAARLIGVPAGGTDAFLTRLSDGGASVTAEWTRYLGTAAAERGHAITVHDGLVYLAGATGGALPGAARQGQVDGFVAQFDASGGLNWVHQYAGYRSQGAAMALAVDGTGSSVLTRPGLPHGLLDYEGARGVSDRTTARPGQSFAVAVDGGRPKTITIEPGESLRGLAVKITMALGLEGRAKVVRSPEGERLRITATGDAAIGLISGPPGRDALGGLGLSPGRLLPGLGQTGEDGASAAASERVFGLGLGPSLRLTNPADAEFARTVLGKTLSTIRSAYRALTRDSALDAAEAQSAQKPAPAYMQRRLAEYRAALARLNGPLPFI